MYLRAESHNKVARSDKTIIFYFARAVSHATVESDRLCFFKSMLPPPPPPLTCNGLTRFRRTSDGDLIPGPEQGFDIVGGYFSADRKSFLFHSSNMHFHITRSSIAFLKKKVLFLC